MSVCPQCDKGKFMKVFRTKVRAKRGQLPRNESFFELDCGHVFTVRDLDEYMEISEGTVMPRKCPKCHQNVAVGSRYGNMVRRSATDAVNIETRKRDLRREATLAPLATLSHATFVKLAPAPFSSIIRYSLTAITPESNEKRCLTEFVDSSLALYLSIESHKTVPGITSLNEQLGNLARALVNKAKSDPRLKQEHMLGAAAHLVPERRESPKLPLTFQLLNDFRSELYRVALRAQCLIARSQNSSLWSVMRASLTRSRHEDAIANTEKYLDFLDPLKDRISEETYEVYFRQIAAAFPNVATVHVETPRVPPVVKGTWMKCSAGHYYCIPPICGTENQVHRRCPDCL